MDGPDEFSGGAAAEAGVSDVERARAAHEEAVAAVEAARGRMASALVATEAHATRIREGDHALSYAEVAEARHQVEVAEYAVQRHENRARQTLEALRRAEAAEIAASWDTRAPKLRAAIRDALEQLLAYDEALFARVVEYNEAAKATEQAFYRLGTKALIAEPTKGLHYLQLRQLISVTSPQDRELAAIGVPKDVLPAGVQPKPHPMASHGTEVPPPPTREVGLTEQAAVEAVRARRVAWSPFTRRNNEEA